MPKKRRTRRPGPAHGGAEPRKRSAAAPVWRIVNMHEAKTHLSRLVDQAAKGEPFIIAKAGKPLVKVVPLDAPASAKGPIGFMEGEFTVPDDFNTMGQEEIIRLFEGEE